MAVEDEVARRIGASIKRAREADGRSQTTLGGDVGVDQSTVSLWEKGKSTPSVEQMLAIDRALDRPPGQLFVDAGLVQTTDDLSFAIRTSTELTETNKDLLLRMLRSWDIEVD